MGKKQNNNSGCVFPFGDGFLPILALMLLDDEERRQKEEVEEDDDINEEDVREGDESDS